MPTLQFTRNERPTLGVEVELQLVDPQSGDLVSGIEQILAELPAELVTSVKPELMQCYLEINTDVCANVAEVRRDLASKLQRLQAITDRLEIGLLWSATHPFSSWRDQEITVNERYSRLVSLMQDVAKRLVTFGLHVHVGVESGDKAVLVCDRMVRHLPLLLALSCNSPFWEGRSTGLQSNRALIMQGLPTAGLPGRMRNYSEYVWLINHLIETGFINTIREIWWDIRPHHNFGTVEVRMCDLPANLDQVIALTALVQCLVVAISREIDEGIYLAEYHPMMVQQNKWRAMRYGPFAQLVDAPHFEPRSVQRTIDELVVLLRPIAVELDCAAELESARLLASQTGAARQLEVFEREGNPQAVVQELLRR